MGFHDVLRRCFSVVLASGKEGTMVGEIEMVSGCRMQVSGSIAAVLAVLCEWCCDWLETMMQNEKALKPKSNKANLHPVERQHTWTELCRCFSHIGSG